MATIDELLVDEPMLGENMYSNSQPIAAKPQLTVKPFAAKPVEAPKTPQTYEEMFVALNPYRPKTQEEIAQENKKRKRDEMFSAIGDGIMALSNLYFTSKGAPNMYDGKNSMSKATQVRYDKLVADREAKDAAYFNGLLKARMADQENAHRERTWQRQLGLDRKEQERYDANQEYRNKRDAITDARYEAEQEYRRLKDSDEQGRWQATFNENKRQADRTYGLQAKKAEDDRTLRAAAIAAKGAKVVRGKQLQFVDAKGNQFPIYESVWKASYPQIFDEMLKEATGNGQKIIGAQWMNAKEMEDYVKKNWQNSPAAIKLMESFSKFDPANMTTTTSEESKKDDGEYDW